LNRFTRWWAQLIGCTAIIVAVAACVARSRFADLGGAITRYVEFVPRYAEFVRQ